jgi:hypothetical protein
VFIDVLLVIGDDRLGDGLSDGIDLRCVPTARDTHADIDAGEFIETNYQYGFVDLSRGGVCQSWRVR